MNNRTSMYAETELEALRAIGPLSALSDDDLKRNNAVRLHDPVARVYSLMASSAYGRLYGICLAILKNCKGYIFAHDLNRIRGFLGRRNIVSEYDLSMVSARARGLRQDGIPPIFREELYRRSIFHYHDPDLGEVEFESLFPSVDFLLQFGAGTYARRCASVAAGFAGRKPSKLPLMPATTEDVVLFRSRAFTPDGRIDPALMLDAADFVESRFDFSATGGSQEVAEGDLFVLSFLEEALRDFPCSRKSYEEWDGDPLVVRERCWYLRFAPPVRERIVQTYLDGLKGRLCRQDANVVRFLQRAYPQQTVGIAQKLGMRQAKYDREMLERRIEDAFERNDFRALPPALFIASVGRSDFLARFMPVLRRLCRELGARTPEGLLTDGRFTAAAINVPARLLFVPECKAIVDEERLACAQRLTDEEARRILIPKRISTIGCSRLREKSAASRALRKYLFKRYRALSGRDAR